MEVVSMIFTHLGCELHFSFMHVNSLNCITFHCIIRGGNWQIILQGLTADTGN